jgi:NAD(P)-dependent dehydrogenase (short-subunit alcohol dehydrogenase family)
MALERLLRLLGSFGGQVVLVTGASSGIGREVAVTFGRLKAAVALMARRRAELAQTARQITEAGGEALVIPTDVTDERAVRDGVATVRRKWKRIDVLVNSAGVLLPARVGEMAAADFERMLRVNVFGALFAMQATLPLMEARGRGTIINIASLAGRRGYSPLGGYCASKFALLGLTEALRMEVDGTDIHVGLVLPGVVDTPMVEGVDQREVLSGWPTVLNMPVEWVAVATILATRFRLREIAVPPGAATLEVLAALSPAMSDTLLGWINAAGRTINRATSRTGEKRPHTRRTGSQPRSRA